jgi:6-phosphogluconolactonase
MMARMAEPEIVVVDSATAIAEAASRRIVEAAREAVAARGRFTVALAGGATPRATYARLTLEPFVDRMPWSRTWFFFGDERCVAPEHPESNYRMAYEAMLSKVPVPPEQVVRIRGELDDAEQAATEYARRIAEVFETRRGEMPRFDLVLLGLGVDGHTASLFPGSPAVREVFRPVVAVHAAAAAIPKRVTLTFPTITAAAAVLFLVSGAEKARAVKAVLVDATMLPAAMARPTDGRLTWLADRDAASLLPARP